VRGEGREGGISRAAVVAFHTFQFINFLLLVDELNEVRWFPLSPSASTAVTGYVHLRLMIQGEKDGGADLRLGAALLKLQR
jgi:hypothetical protein